MKEVLKAPSFPPSRGRERLPKGGALSLALLTALAIVAVLCALPCADNADASSSGTCGERDSDDLTWTLDDDGNLTISGSGWMRDDYSPWGNAVKHVVIGEGVINIGASAFSHCTYLESVSMPSVRNIDEFAFSDCVSLSSVYIPSTVGIIRNFAFLSCSSLESIDVSTYNDSYSSSNGVLFNKNKTYLMTYPAGKQDVTYAIPSSVTSIESYAFSGCTSLVSVTIPSSVTNIYNEVFRDCTSLVSINVSTYNGSYSSSNGVLFDKNKTCLKEYPAGKQDVAYTIPSSVTSITSHAFSGCASLVSIDIHSMTSIGEGAFWGCASLVSVDIPSVTSIKGNTFYDCTSLESVNMPSVTSIESYAFWGCASLASVAMPSVTSIGYHAFRDCASLVSVDIPSVTSIRSNAFRGCASLESVNMPSVTSIGESAFQGCASLVSVDIPSVTSIERITFYGCPSLESVNMPSVTSIGSSAFWDCASLASVSIPSSVTSIGNQAFRDCASLESVNMPSVTSIGELAFYGCASLESVNMPSVTSIGYSAFSGCASLEFVTIPTSVTSIGNYAFQGLIFKDYNISLSHNVDSLAGHVFYGHDGVLNTARVNDSCEDSESGLIFRLISESPAEVAVIGSVGNTPSSISIPGYFKGCAVTSIEENAFSGCTALEEVTLPSALRSIGQSAFYGCSSLASVSIPSKVTSIGAGAFQGCSSLTLPSLPESLKTIGDNAFDGISLPVGSEIDLSFNSGEFSASMFGSNFGIYENPAGFRFKVSQYANVKYLSKDPERAYFKDCGGGCRISVFDDGMMSLVYYGGDPYLSDRIWDAVAKAREEGAEVEQIVVSPGSSNYVYADNDGVLFSADGKELISYPSGKPGSSYTLPSSVETISPAAFSAAVNLEELRVQEGSMAFMASDGVLFSKDQRVLAAYPSGKGDAVFTVPKSVRHIAPAAFSGACNLKEIKAEPGSEFNSRGGVLYSDHFRVLEAYPSGSFDEEFSIPATVRSIGDYSFAGSPHLSGIVIPSSVRSVGDCAFKMCSALESVSFGVYVEEIGDRVLSGCSSLSEADLSSVRDDCKMGDNSDIGISIGGITRSADGGLRTYVPENGHSGFYHDGGVDSDVRYFSAYRFYEDIGRLTVYGIGPMHNFDFSVIKDGVRTVAVTDGVSSIGKACFQDFHDFGISIAPSVSSIHWYAFNMCDGVMFAEIPMAYVHKDDGSPANGLVFNGASFAPGKTWELRAPSLEVAQESGVFVKPVISGGNGTVASFTVSGPGFYEEGSWAEVGLYLNDGTYEFVGWYVDGKKLEPQLSYEERSQDGAISSAYYTLMLIVTGEERTVECRLSANPISISYGPTGEGFFNLSGPAEGLAGESLEFTVELDTDYVYDQDWGNEFVPSAVIRLSNGKAVVPVSKLTRIDGSEIDIPDDSIGPKVLCTYTVRAGLLDDSCEVSLNLFGPRQTVHLTADCSPGGWFENLRENGRYNNGGSYEITLVTDKTHELGYLYVDGAETFEFPGIFDGSGEFSERRAATATFVMGESDRVIRASFVDDTFVLGIKGAGSPIKGAVEVEYGREGRYAYPFIDGGSVTIYHASLATLASVPAIGATPVKVCFDETYLGKDIRIEYGLYEEGEGFYYGEQLVSGASGLFLIQSMVGHDIGASTFSVRDADLGESFDVLGDRYVHTIMKSREADGSYQVIGGDKDVDLAFNTKTTGYASEPCLCIKSVSGGFSDMYRLSDLAAPTRSGSTDDCYILDKFTLSKDGDSEVNGTVYGYFKYYNRDREERKSPLMRLNFGTQNFDVDTDGFLSGMENSLSFSLLGNAMSTLAKFTGESLENMDINLHPFLRVYVETDYRTGDISYQLRIGKFSDDDGPSVADLVDCIPKEGRNKAFEKFIDKCKKSSGPKTDKHAKVDLKLAEVSYFIGGYVSLTFDPTGQTLKSNEACIDAVLKWQSKEHVHPFTVLEIPMYAHFQWGITLECKFGAFDFLVASEGVSPSIGTVLTFAIWANGGVDAGAPFLSLGLCGSLELKIEFSSKSESIIEGSINGQIYVRIKTPFSEHRVVMANVTTGIGAEIGKMKLLARAIECGNADDFLKKSGLESTIVEWRYLDHRTEGWVVWDYSSDTLQEWAYPASEPDAMRHNGESVMSLAFDDGSGVTMDYSWFDGGAWSVPAPIIEKADGTVDYGAEMGISGEGIRVVWSRVAYSLSEGETLDQYRDKMSSSELWTAAWDPLSKEFRDAEPIPATSGNGCSETSYGLSSHDGNAVVFWAEVSGESILIKAFERSEDGWTPAYSESIPVSGDFCSVSDLDVYWDGQSFSHAICYSVTADVMDDGTCGYSEASLSVGDITIEGASHFKRDGDKIYVLMGQDVYAYGLPDADIGRLVCSGVSGPFEIVSDGVSRYLCWSSGNSVLAAVQMEDAASGSEVFYGPLELFTAEHRDEGGTVADSILSFSVMAEGGGIRGVYSVLRDCNGDGTFDYAEESTEIAQSYRTLSGDPSISGALAYQEVGGSALIRVEVSNQSALAHEELSVVVMDGGQATGAMEVGSVMPGGSWIMEFEYANVLDRERDVGLVLLKGDKELARAEIHMAPAAETSTSMKFVDGITQDDSYYSLSTDLLASNASDFWAEFELCEAEFDGSMFQVGDTISGLVSIGGAVASLGEKPSAVSGSVILNVPFTDVFPEDEAPTRTAVRALVVSLHRLVENEDGTESEVVVDGFVEMVTFYNFRMVSAYFDYGAPQNNGSLAVTQVVGYPGQSFGKDSEGYDLLQNPAKNGFRFTGVWEIDGPAGVYYDRFPACMPEHDVKYTAIYAPMTDDLHGECGRNAEYAISKVGREITLTIYGSGPVENDGWYSPYKGLYREGDSLRVVIQGGVTEIRPAAFRGYSELEYVELPSTVSLINAEAFDGCSGIAEISIPDENSAFVCKDGMLFRHTDSGLELAFCLVIPEGGEIALPADVAAIGDHAFYGKPVASVQAPGVTHIGKYAFGFCGSLHYLSAPSVVDIGKYAFQKCSSIAFAGRDGQGLSFGSGLRAIGEGAFEHCEALESADLSEMPGLSSVGAYAFMGCRSMESFRIPAVGSVELGDNAFAFSGLRSFEVTEALERADHAFYNCYSLESFTANGDPDTSEWKYTARDGILYERTGGTLRLSACPSSVALDGGVLRIGDDVSDVAEGSLSGIPGISGISLGANQYLEVIGGILYKRASGGAYELILCPTGIQIPGGSLEINVRCVILSNAFVGVGSLEHLTLGPNVTETRAGAFYADLGLRTVTILADSDTNLSSICMGKGSFSGCTSLESVSMPKLSPSLFGEQRFYSSGSGCDAFLADKLDDGTAVLLRNGSAVTWGYFRSMPGVFELDGSPLSLRAMHTISIDADGGRIEDPDWVSAEECAMGGLIVRSALYHRTVSEGSEVVLPAVNKEGRSGVEFSFDGWGQRTVVASEDVLLRASFTAEGKAGPHALFEFREGEITIYGEGPMLDFDVSPPWGGMDVRSVLIGDGITSVGDHAFSGCPGIESVEISASVGHVSPSAFIGYSFVYPDGSSDPVPAPGYRYEGSGTILSVTGVLIEADVGDRFISSGLVYEVASLYPLSASLVGYEGSPTDVAVPACVEVGGWEAQVVSVASKAFYNCGSLTSLDLGSVTEVGAKAFARCPIDSVIVRGDVGSSAFAGCKELAILSVLSGSSLGSYAFHGCSSLESIEFGDDLGAISESAFSGLEFAEPDGTSVPVSAGTLEGSTFHSDESGRMVRHLEYVISIVTEGMGTVTVDSVAAVFGDSITASGSVLTVAGTQSIAVPSPADAQYTYRFVGWEIPEHSVTGDSTVTAVFERVVNEYTVSVVSQPAGFGSVTVDRFEGVPYGTALSTAGGAFTVAGRSDSVAIPSEGDGQYAYRFVGWEVPVETVVGDVAVIAMFECSIDAPSPVFGLVYNGEEQTGVPSGAGYTLEGGSATGAGTYTAVLTPDEGCVWDDGTSAPKHVEWEISKAVLTAVYVGETIFEGSSPAYEVSVTGFVGGESASTASGYNAPTIVNDNLSVGSRLLAPSGGSARDYVFEYVSGTLTVKLATTVDSGICGDNLTWTLDYQGVLIIEGTGPMADWNSNSTPWGAHCKDVVTVIIGDGVTSIGSYVFHGCSALSSVSIPSSVTSIRSYAFWGCSALSSVSIPSSVTHIGSFAFWLCSSLERFEGENEGIVNGVMLLYRSSVVAFAVGSGVSEVVIPEGVTSIGGGAFHGCSALSSVHIPEGVTSIGIYAFDGCSALSSVHIPEGVTSIGDFAFWGCSSLSSVHVPPSLTSIGSDAFRGCSSLPSISIPSSVITIKDGAFFGCSSLERFEGEYEGIVNGVMLLNGQNFVALAAGSGASEVVIPEGVTSIGGGAFYGCSALSSVHIPEGVTSIGNYAFGGCSSLSSLSIPEGVTSIGNYAFGGCSSLSSLSIPEGVTNIWYGAFGDLVFRGYSGEMLSHTPTALAGHTFLGSGDKVLSMAYGVSVSASDSDACLVYGSGWYLPGAEAVVSAEPAAGCVFEGWYDGDVFLSSDSEYRFVVQGNLSLTAVVTPNGVGTQVRASGLVYEITSLDPLSATLVGYEGSPSDVVVPASVKVWGRDARVVSVASKAFYRCGTLASVDLGSVAEVGQKAFANCSSLTSLEVPDTVERIGTYAFYGCKRLTSLTIPGDGVVLEPSAFSACVRMKSVSFTGTGAVIERNAFYKNNGVETLDLSTVASVGYKAFPYCKGLTTLTIPGTLESLGGYAFYSCAKLRTLVVEEGVKAIGASAFSECRALQSISLPGSLESIGRNAFYGVKLYDLGGSLISQKAEFSASGTFEGADGKLWQTASFSVDGLEYSASNGTAVVTGYEGGIVDLVVPRTVEYGGYALDVVAIGDRAFRACAALTTADLGGVLTVGNRAFSECSGLSSVEMPSVERLDDYALFNCKAIERISFSGSLSHIGTSALYGVKLYGADGATRLTAAEDLAGTIFEKTGGKLRPALPEVGDELVSGGVKYVLTSSDPLAASAVRFVGEVSALPSAVVFSGYEVPVTSVADGAFRLCTTISALDLSNVVSIGTKAFSGCTGLESVTFSENLAKVGSSAFYGTQFYYGGSSVPRTATGLSGHSFEGSGGSLHLVS